MIKYSHGILWVCVCAWKFCIVLYCVVLCAPARVLRISTFHSTFPALSFFRPPSLPLRVSRFDVDFELNFSIICRSLWHPRAISHITYKKKHSITMSNRTMCRINYSLDICVGFFYVLPCTSESILIEIILLVFCINNKYFILIPTSLVPALSLFVSIFFLLFQNLIKWISSISECCDEIFSRWIHLKERTKSKIYTRTHNASGNTFQKWTTRCNQLKYFTCFAQTDKLYVTPLLFIFQLILRGLPWEIKIRTKYQRVAFVLSLRRSIIRLNKQREIENDYVWKQNRIFLFSISMDQKHSHTW